MPHSFDPNPRNIAIPQLVQLHAQLGAKLRANAAERVKLASDMKHVEAVIRLFDSSYDVRRIAVKRRNARNPWFKRGTLFRAALSMLREADSPLSTLDIAKRLLSAKGSPEPSRQELRKLDASLRSSMNHNDGKAVQKVGNERPARWALPHG
jgi:hypothetical protein